MEINKCCCFTGHRSISGADAGLSVQLLCEVETLINTHGVTVFYTGGAVGFDALAAECVLALKGKYPFIRLNLALPCKNQSRNWSETEKKRYNVILSRADSVHYVSEAYTDDCMHKRNDYMVQSSGYCICYLRRNSGGTYYTVERAKSLGRVLIRL